MLNILSHKQEIQKHERERECVCVFKTVNQLVLEVK